MSTIPIFRFRPNRVDAARWLGPTQAAILEYLWEAERPRTVKQIWRAVGDGRALTTIGTHLLRMADAGLLLRSGSYTSLFAPALTRAEFEGYQFNAILTAIGCDAVAAWLAAQPQEEVTP